MSWNRHRKRRTKHTILVRLSRSFSGKVSFPPDENIRLSNNAAMLIRSIPDDAEIIDD